MTRDLDWGVKVPLPDTEGKVLYVWFDAPIGYISATKELAQNTGLDWEKYWKDDDSKLVHFIAKDNIVFHCIIFPAILKAHGYYILPENVPANEFLNLEGNKISTSRNWAVWLHEYLEEFKGKQDVLRYVLTANAPETKDNDFTWKDFQARNNNELVAVFGNFVNRAMVLTEKNFNAAVPEKFGVHDAFDEAVIHAIKIAPGAIASSIENYRFREALSFLMELARAGNKYLADTEPWKLIKTNPERVQTILNLALQVSANLAILCEPFMPFTSAKLKGMLNLTGLKWTDAGNAEILPIGHQLNKSELLFDKIDDEAIEAQVKKLQAAKEANEAANRKVAPPKDPVSFDDFGKMDIRTATILEAEKVPKTAKLLKLKLDTGLDIRTVVSGIAEHYTPENIIGQQVCLLANLAPRNIKGIESQGMILMAEDLDGKLRFITPTEKVTDGSVIS
jgi:methionyl-tRNA synthetase